MAKIDLEKIDEPFLYLYPVTGNAKKNEYVFNFNFAGDLMVLADFFSNMMQEKDGALYLFRTTIEMYNEKIMLKHKKKLKHDKQINSSQLNFDFDVQTK